MRYASVLLLALAVCATPSCAAEPPPLPLAPLPIAATVRPDESHLSDIVQLTFDGDNTHARWAWGSQQVVLETRGGAADCGHVVRVSSFDRDPPSRATIVAGRGPSFLPGDQDIVYAASPKCTRAPDAPKGARLLDPELDLFRAKVDGTSPRRLTETAGYDAEASVCAKDGSIVFTSMRDGDPDLYRMDADGGNVKRLTASPGYDGDAAFDPDCSRIVWLASRPRGAALDDYKKQLEGNMLSARATELWVANADGTDARQVTYLDARASSPAWYPTQVATNRIAFATTFRADNPRDADVWAIDVDGTNLERVTTAPGADVSPSFSPDGKWFAFTSSRATTLGRKDTNVLVAKWGGASRHVEEMPADHLMGDAAWLANPAREGRGLGTKGLEDAGAYVERSFKSWGLTPAGDDGEFRQDFDVTTKVAGQVSFSVGGGSFDPSRLRALGFSSSSAVDGALFFIGSNDDFAKVDVKGKIAVVRQSGRGSMQHTAWLAREAGAVGILVVAEGGLPEPIPESNEGIAAAVVAADAVRPLLAMLVRGQHPAAKLAVTLAPETAAAFNVAGRWPSSVAPDQKLPGVIVVGAHYDHIGETSPGADDNASGTAALLQVARSLSAGKVALRRDVILVAFSGEDQGAAGADAFVRHAPGGLNIKDVMAMVNLDMVGRLRDNTLQVFGEETATQWPDLIAGACESAHIECARATSGGFGASDHTAFYEAGVPVVHLYTGVHGDYRKPTDTVDKLNAGGMAQVARAAEQLARDLSDLGSKLEYQRVTNAIESDVPEFRVSLGTIPDRAGPPGGQKGMLLAGVRAGGAADKAGLQKGDILIRLGGHVIGGAEDVMFVLTGAKPGTKLKAVVLRGGKEVAVELTLEEARK